MNNYFIQYFKNVSFILGKEVYTGSCILIHFSMDDQIYADAVQLHQEHGGKLAIQSKVSVANYHDLSLAYTPGVAQVCKEIYADASSAKKLTLKKNTVAIISDGSAVLGLGNLGALAAIPVMEGKAILFKQFAGVDAFPICLDTQDTEEIIQTIKRIAPVFGGINLEDIAAPRCFEIERRLQTELDIPVLHDDQHGTATVVLAGLINAIQLRELKKENAKIVLNGAGAAGTAIAKLLLEYGFKNLILCDSHGAIYSGREEMNEEKELLANMTNPQHITGGLREVVEGADIFIGVSKGGLLSAEIVRSMAPCPIIFAMANPEPEIMPTEAKAAGAFIVATGRSDFPNQINNVLAFPGIFRGALDNGVIQITSAMLIQAAKNLAAQVREPATEKIIPSPFDAGVAESVAKAIQK